MFPTTVYTGHWIDWSYGRVLGSRITMSSSNAGLLIAFIALFDSVVGTVVWNLLSYAIFHARASDTPRDASSHQIQALLRNSNEPLSFARYVVASGWEWRKIAPHALLRATFLATLAVLTTISFSAVGVLSSRIATSGEVLLTASACQSIQSPSLGDVQAEEFDALFLQQISSMGNLALEYARNCYPNPLLNHSLSAATTLTPEADCSFYVKPAATWNTTYNNPCPFESACSVPESQIIKLDTGLLDSNDDLGINTPPENRVKFRRINICSPLTTDGFSNNTFYDPGLTGLLSNISSYAYGWSSVMPVNFLVGADANDFNNWASAYNVSFIYPASSYLAGDIDFNLQSVSFLQTPNMKYDAFIPDGRLTKNPVEPLTLLFLANRGYYTDSPVDDPWFRAENATSWVEGYGTDDIYYSAQPGAVLGCSEQLQICNPSNRLCTDPPRWWYDHISNSTPFGNLGLNSVQSAIATHIVDSAQSSSFTEMATAFGEEMLEAFDHASSATQLLSPTLPSNQWQIEMERFMAVSFSYFQRLNLFWVTGPTDERLLKFYHPYELNDTVSHTLCASQKIRDSAYQSFSVLGLTINFVIGSLFILAGVTSANILPRIQKRREKRYKGISRSRRSLWIANGLLQNQRRAYERLNHIEWEGDEDSVPITTELATFRAPTATTYNALPPRGEQVSSQSDPESLSTNQDPIIREVSKSHMTADERSRRLPSQILGFSTDDWNSSSSRFLDEPVEQFMDRISMQDSR